MKPRVIGSAMWCLAMSWFFLTGRAVPLLSLVDLGFHELGHFVTYVLPWDLVTAAMGSVAQMAVPLGCAAYFLAVRSDRVAAAVCLAWEATSAWGVHVYIADAPYERLALIGGDHDWAFILFELDRMSWAGPLARMVWLFGLACIAAGLALVAKVALDRSPSSGDRERPRATVLWSEG